MSFLNKRNKTSNIDVQRAIELIDVRWVCTDDSDWIYIAKELKDSNSPLSPERKFSDNVPVYGAKEKLTLAEFEDALKFIVNEIGETCDIQIHVEQVIYGKLHNITLTGEREGRRVAVFGMQYICKLNTTDQLVNVMML